MKTKEVYSGIDCFRVISALLVIAIHTSPLLSLNAVSDFVLTRVIARVAVPFFFMASGFFLIPQYLGKKELRSRKLVPFVKKVAVLYGIAILLYLPINIYAKYFESQHLISKLIKDLIFNGTFYHLWYLPAVILGAIITCLLLQVFKPRNVLVIAVLLYVIGLFGDSYYGIIENVPPLKSFYDGIFTVSEYTRNGLFFAPVFILLGGMVAKKQGSYNAKACSKGLMISFALLVTEGLILRSLKLQRHDSMYLALVPCMVFLFLILVKWKARDFKIPREFSLTVYIIHPLIIVFVRGIAKATGLKTMLIDNSMMHFLAVAAASFIGAMLISKLIQLIKKKGIDGKQDYIDRAWLEIKLDNLAHNAEAIMGTMQNGCELMAVVKANAYGHGDIEVAERLNYMGVRSFAVATIDEAIRLRKNGIKGDILILGYTMPKRAPELKKYDLSQTVVDYNHARQMNAFGKQISVHIKIDTGMHRLGEEFSNITEIENIFLLHNLKIKGIFTHLCAPDNIRGDEEFTRLQMRRFYTLIDQLKQRNVLIPKVHIQSSYGLLNYPEIQSDYARIGIALYGILSSIGHETKVRLSLKPVLSLKARVALVRGIEVNERVSYGRSFTAAENTLVAVLPIGYADGVPRSLSGGKGHVLINGCSAPIIGLVCMDQLMIDVTNVPNVKQGDIAVLIGRDGNEEITAEEVAASAETITNELLSRLGSRLERVFI